MKLQKLVSTFLVSSLLVSPILPISSWAQSSDATYLEILGPSGPNDVIEVIIENQIVNPDGSVTADLSIKASRLIAYDITFEQQGDVASWLENIDFLPLYPKNTYSVGQLTFPPGSSLIIKQDKWGYSAVEAGKMAVIDVLSLILILVGATPPASRDIDTILDTLAEIVLVFPQAENLELIAAHNLLTDIESHAPLLVILFDILDLVDQFPLTTEAIANALLVLGYSVSALEVSALLSSIELLFNAPQVVAGIIDWIAYPRHLETTVRVRERGSVIIDVALIIDSTGSMVGSDPQGMRKAAAKVFIDSVQGGDKVAVIAFNTTDRHLAPLRAIQSQADRDVLKMAVDQVGSYGCTNLNVGLSGGFEELLSDSSGNRKAAIFLTDGRQECSGPYNPQSHLQYKSRGWPVYTIGLGSGADESLLRQIATDTGGQYRALADPNELQAVYFEIFHNMTGRNIVMNGRVMMTDGSREQVAVHLPIGQSFAMFFSGWPGSEVSMSLTSPTGRKIGPSSVDPDVYHVKGLTYEIYTIQYPGAGRWVIDLYGTSLPPGGEQVDVRVATEGPRFVYLPVTVKDYASSHHSNPPNIPSSPIPSDGSAYQPTNVSLRWIGGDPDGDVVTYDIYLVSDDGVSGLLSSASQPDTRYTPGTLRMNTIYYWQVVARDRHGTRVGPVWRFITGSPPSTATHTPTLTPTPTATATPTPTPTATPTPTPTPIVSGEVSVVGAWTADGNWNPKTTFASGDPIQWVINVDNTTGGDAPIELTYDVRGSNGEQVVYWNGTVATEAGSWAWGLPGTVAGGMFGTHAFSGYGSYQGIVSQAAVTYFVTGPSIGMIETGSYRYPENRLNGLGCSVSLLPVDAGLEAFRQYDIVYLPVGWADGFSGNYSEIEAHAADYRTYTAEGGGLFTDQPNPFRQPNESVSPSVLPYAITFYNIYNTGDWPPIIVNADHYITSGLLREDMPGPADQITAIDPAYEVLVRGQVTNSPSLAVAEYGQGRVVVQTDHPGADDFGEEVYRRMIEWVSSGADSSGSLSVVGGPVPVVVP